VPVLAPNPGDASAAYCCRCGVVYVLAARVCMSVGHNRELCKNKLNRSRCHLGYGLRWNQGTMDNGGRVPRKGTFFLGGGGGTMQNRRPGPQEKEHFEGTGDSPTVKYRRYPA